MTCQMMTKITMMTITITITVTVTTTKLTVAIITTVIETSLATTVALGLLPPRDITPKRALTEVWHILTGWGTLWISCLPCPDYR